MLQPDLLRRVVGILEEQDIPYIVVGSYASAAYGRARLTNDIDIVVDLRLDKVEQLLAEFPAGEYYYNLETAKEAIRSRRQFNIIHPGSGNKIDFMIARKDEWGNAQLSRRERRDILPDFVACVAKPEDVILGKMIYYQEGSSSKHLSDIAGILGYSRTLLDMEYLNTWIAKLKLTEIWEAILSSEKKT